VPPEEYQAWRSRLRLSPPPAPPVVDEVRIADTRFINREHLREGVGQKEGEQLASDRLARDLVVLHSQGDLQNLDYSVLKGGGTRRSSSSRRSRRRGGRTTCASA